MPDEIIDTVCTRYYFPISWEEDGVEYKIELNNQVRHPYVLGVARTGFWGRSSVRAVDAIGTFEAMKLVINELHRLAELRRAVDRAVDREL